MRTLTIFNAFEKAQGEFWQIVMKFKDGDLKRRRKQLIKLRHKLLVRLEKLP